MTRCLTLTLLLCICSLLGGKAQAQGTLCSWLGGASDSAYGGGLCRVGDFNGDGIPDIALSDPYDSTAAPNAGAVFVYSTTSCTSPLGTFYGQSAEDRMGEVSPVGDVNGDGFDDLLIGTPRDTTVATWAGMAYIEGGGGAGTLWSGYGSAAYDWFGGIITGLGDVNLDGFPDWLVASPTANVLGVANAGRVQVFSGKDGAVLFDLHGTVWQAAYGSGADSVGDMNQDGRPDFIVGSPGEPGGYGSVSELSGLDVSVLRSWIGGTYEFLGFGPRAAGDVNADGTCEVLVWSLSGAGGGDPGISLLDGTSNMLLDHFVGTASSHDPMDGLGNINGDAVADYIRFGVSMDLEIRRGGSFDLLARTPGWNVTGVEDVDGDGFGDYFRRVPITSDHKQWRVDLISGRCDGVNPFGSGCPGGSGKTPRLVIEAPCDLKAFAAVTLLLDEGVPYNPALLVFGAQPAGVPAGPCTLNVWPLVGPLLLLFTDSGGRAAVAAVVPPGLAGQSVHTQAFVADALTVNGFSASSGLTLTFQ
ncbi:MAG: FG-GAP repeat protein [Planctomycetes bacterium]|nr:FG-GAP repeat protein [Planctomycetota bacterium]